MKIVKVQPRKVDEEYMKGLEFKFSGNPDTNYLFPTFPRISIKNKEEEYPDIDLAKICPFNSGYKLFVGGDNSYTIRSPMNGEEYTFYNSKELGDTLRPIYDELINIRFKLFDILSEHTFSGNTEKVIGNLDELNKIVSDPQIAYEVKRDGEIKKRFTGIFPRGSLSEYQGLICKILPTYSAEPECRLDKLDIGYDERFISIDFEKNDVEKIPLSNLKEPIAFEL